MIDQPGFVFLNGRFVAAKRATVSVYDRGLLYGDGLFETMRAYRGVAYALEDHIERLLASARVLGIPFPDHDWGQVIAELLRRNRLTRTDAWVRLTVTRGPSEATVMPPELPRPTTLIMSRAVERNLADKQRDGVAVTLLPYSRHGFIPEHKTLNYLPAVVGKILAARHGSFEGLFVRGDHFLTEGTTCSLFVVHNKAVWTTPVGGILPGVTRRLLLDLALANRLRVVERELTTSDLRSADEAFLTSSISEIVPIIQVGETRVGTGHPGPVTRKLQQLFSQSVERYCRAVRTLRAAR